MVLLRLDSMAAPGQEAHNGCREKMLQEKSFHPACGARKRTSKSKRVGETPCRPAFSIFSPLNPPEILLVAVQSDFSGQIDRHLSLWGRAPEKLCFPRVWGQISFFFSLSPCSHQLAPEADTVVKSAWQSGKTKTPAFWPEDWKVGCEEEGGQESKSIKL